MVAKAKTVTNKKMGQSKDQPKNEEPKEAKKKLQEVHIQSPLVKNQLGLTDEPIYLVEELLDGTEVKVRQGDNEFVVGKETLS